MEFFLLATAHFLALLSPGPDFFLILQAALRYPRRYGLAVCGGIALANGVYLCLAVTGLELVKEVGWLMWLLRLGGSCFLLYLGIMLLKAPRQQEVVQTDSELNRQPPKFASQFMVGFLSGILNPKNMVFYLSLFTTMVSAETAFTTRCLYAVWMTSVVLLWDCLVVLLVHRLRLQTSLGGSTIFYVEKFSGGMLAALGAALPFT